MTNRERILQTIYRYGVPATVSILSGGTACPCLTSRDSANPTYSADWHRRNPTSADCHGTGVINSTTTAITIKTMPMSVSALAGTVRPDGKEVEIGKIDIGDMVLYGAVKISDASHYDFSVLSESNEIKLNSQKYCVKDVVFIQVENDPITAAICKRVS